MLASCSVTNPNPNPNPNPSPSPNPSPNPNPNPSPNQLYTRNESTAWSRAEAEFDRICVHYGLSCVSLYEVRLSLTTSIA